MRLLKIVLLGLRKQIDARKLKMQAALHAQKSITENDEAWLDSEGNPGTQSMEEHVVDLLENASTFQSLLKSR